MQVRYQALRGGSICPSTAYQGVETLYTYIIWIWEALNDGSTSSDRSSPTPQITKKIHPHFRWGTRAKDGSTYPHTAYLGAETPYIHI
jgi:hypothetical protein